MTIKFVGIYIFSPILLILASLGPYKCWVGQKKYLAAGWSISGAFRTGLVFLSSSLYLREKYIVRKSER